jgi:hypothetical protein
MIIDKFKDQCVKISEQLFSIVKQTYNFLNIQQKSDI